MKCNVIQNNVSFIFPQRRSINIIDTNHKTVESISKRLFDYGAPVEHLTGLPDSDGSGAEETNMISKTNMIFKTVLKDACEWVGGIDFKSMFYI